MSHACGGGTDSIVNVIESLRDMIFGDLRMPWVSGKESVLLRPKLLIGSIEVGFIEPATLVSSCAS